MDKSDVVKLPVVANQTQALSFWETDESKRLLKDSVFKGSSDQEFMVLMAVAKARNLDPWKKQIHGIKVWNKEDQRFDIVAITGIDGARAMAHRTGEYAGMDEIEYDYNRSSPNYPVKAKVTVYRMVQGEPRPWTGEAMWSEYYPGDKKGFKWRDMPRTMLGKCAEMQALRKAFPEECGGMYVAAEFDKRQITDNEASHRTQNLNAKLLGKAVETEAVAVGDEPIAEPASSDEPHAYIIPSGSLKGKRLSEIDHDVLRKYCIDLNNLIFDRQEEGVAVSEDIQKTADMIRRYLEE